MTGTFYPPTAVGNFFRYAQNSEANRVASIAWGKFQRQLAVELALHPKDRIDCMDFLKICRSELDRLIEQSPQLSDDVISEYEVEFGSIPNLKRPDIAHGMIHTKVFDDKDARLKNIAVEATLMLKQRRRILQESLIPEVDKRLEANIRKKINDLSGTIFAPLEAKLKELESRTDACNTQTTQPFTNTINPSTGSPTRDTIRVPVTPLTLQNVNQILPGIRETSSDQLLNVLTTVPNKGVSVNPLIREKHELEIQSDEKN